MNAAGPGAEVLIKIDGLELSRLHLRILLISGMGFLADAYDLFIIGVVMEMVRHEWSVSPTAEGLVTSTALLSSAFGALLFGRLADMIGRKPIYGIEVLVLAAGAIASALAPNIGWLIGFRIILGIGVGGDYPVSSTIMAEYACKRSRGMLVSLVFGMQAVGLIVGPLLAAALIAIQLPEPIVWRALLAFGAVPALAVYQMRRSLAETPRYLLAAGRHEEFKDAARRLLGETDASAESDLSPKQPPQRFGFREGFSILVRSRTLAPRLIGASLAWFFMDFAYYGNTVSSPIVLAAIAPHQRLLSRILLQLAIFAIAAAPGYVLAAATMDRIGRKPIQTTGFAVMAASFAAMAVLPGVERFVLPFVIIYGVSYFFTEFGPNATTFVYPAEIFPVEARATGHGIASAAGKIGGFVGVFLFPILMRQGGLFAAESAAAIVSILGLIVTVWLLPETKLKSLEELAADPGMAGLDEECVES
jgi:MFS transporter, PHS family, inorganic phosphate transporter